MLICLAFNPRQDKTWYFSCERNKEADVIGSYYWRRSSISVLELLPWLFGDNEKNSYYYWPCLILGNRSNLNMWIWHTQTNVSTLIYSCKRQWYSYILYSGLGHFLINCIFNSMVLVSRPGTVDHWFVKLWILLTPVQHIAKYMTCIYKLLLNLPLSQLKYWRHSCGFL